MSESVSSTNPARNRSQDSIQRPADREFSLQFFAAEDEGRTEEPTERKKQEAIDEGNVPSTMELASALIMAAGFSMIWFFGTWMVWELKAFSHKILSLQYVDGVRRDNVGVLFGNMAWLMIKVVGPVAAASYAAAIFAFMIQTGPQFTLEPLQFDLSAIQPSFQKLLDEMIFSKQVLWDFIKSLMKVFTVMGVATEVIYTNFDGLLTLINMSLLGAIGIVMQMTFEIILKTILLLLFVMSPLDYAFEYYEWYQDLKMTKQEVEDEQKQQEGDPEMQERQQERMQEMSEKRMMEEVPEADVVITNPTHYAVALQYDEASMEAPTVLARGKGMTAQRIKSLARENGIPVYEVPLLARTLYDLELGEQIPQSLYESVATVLKWVHEQKNDAPKQERVHIEQDLKELDLAAAG